MRAKGVFFELSESLSTDENRQTAHPPKQMKTNDHWLYRSRTVSGEIIFDYSNFRTTFLPKA